MQEWSGQVTANSLPVEVRARKAGMARLIESSLRMPNVQEGGRHYATPSGFPSTVTLQAGGVYKVEVSSLAVKSADMSLGNDSEVGYDDVPTDAFGRAAKLSNTFREFARDTIGRVRVQEAHGPKAGYLGATGIYPDDFPHRPGYGSRRARGDNDPFGRPGQPRPSYSRGLAGEVRDHPGLSCGQMHPGQDHSDWMGQEEEEEERYGARLHEQRRHESAMIRIQERQFKNHYGLLTSCALSHPLASHTTWRQG